MLPLVIGAMLIQAMAVTEYYSINADFSPSPQTLPN